MQQRPGMIIGKKGQKYGLITRTDKQKQPPAKPAGGALAAFGADSDSDEDIGAQVARQAARKVADSKVCCHLYVCAKAGLSKQRWRHSAGMLRVSAECRSSSSRRGATVAPTNLSAQHVCASCLTCTTTTTTITGAGHVCDSTCRGPQRL